MVSAGWLLSTATPGRRNGLRRARGLRRRPARFALRFYEYEAKALFRRHGLPLGESHIAIFKEWPLFFWCVVRNVVARAKPQPVPARSRETKLPVPVEIHK